MRSGIIFTALAFLMSGCGFPYPGTIQELPEREITVTDLNGNTLSGFDMYVFRCTDPGSKLDKVFEYLNQKSGHVEVTKASKIGWKHAGYAWLAPDFAISYEPQPYWVACVAKQGYQSRRWSLGNSIEGKQITIKLRPGRYAGPDACTTEHSDCTVCRSYEYFMYEEMRYRHGACPVSLISSIDSGSPS